ncbi:hypothetical protein MMC22_005314 [Lobaria immixta]|nr:hypothetical protein [Lobaria immixta]
MSESSTMGASGGTIGHGILPDSGNLFSIPEGALEIEWSDEPYVTPEEECILRTNLNHRRMERVSGSDEPMVDATTNEEDSLANAVPDVTFGPQEDNTGASTPTSIEGLPQTNPTGTTIGFFPTVPMHPPSSPQIPIDPVLLHMDAVNFNNGRDPTIRNPRDACVWPESPHDSKKQTESKKGN